MLFYYAMDIGVMVQVSDSVVDCYLFPNFALTNNALFTKPINYKKHLF